MIDTFASQIASTGITVRPRHFHISKDHRSLLGRSLALRFGLVLYMLMHASAIAVSLYGEWFVDSVINEKFRDAVEAYDAGVILDSYSNNINIASILVMLYCIVTYCMFVHRAASNIENASAKGLSVTPGWAVGWSFIPFVNLFKIYQIMREIWTASADPKRGVRGGSAILAIWWICYVTGNIVSQTAGRMADSALRSATPYLDELKTVFWLQAGGSVLGFLAGLILFIVVGGITRNQARWKSIPVEEPPAPAANALGF
ncbi:MAG: DUF4328 domain-containing protein [Hyphomonadaceae bacterium]